MKRKGGLGWVRLPASRAVETLEERFWRSLDLKGLVVYDVGAFKGTLTMFFASRCAHVVSYEPNSINYTRLLENLRLNALNNVTVRKLGVGASSGSGDLVFMPLMTGGGSLERKTVDQLKKSGAAVESERIQITTIDQDITDAGLPRPDFIKIDIEGSELEALKGAAETLAAYGPTLFLEMHGETLREKKRKVTEIVDWLAKAGYADVRHIETGTPITLANATVAIEGHLYCPRASRSGR
jgi:FkbM family methyltransferase